MGPLPLGELMIYMGLDASFAATRLGIMDDSGTSNKLHLLKPRHITDSSFKHHYIHAKDISDELKGIFELYRAHRIVVLTEIPPPTASYSPGLFIIQTAIWVMLEEFPSLWIRPIENSLLRALFGKNPSKTEIKDFAMAPAVPEQWMAYRGDIDAKLQHNLTRKAPAEAYDAVLYTYLCRFKMLTEESPHPRIPMYKGYKEDTMVFKHRLIEFKRWMGKE